MKQTKKDWAVVLCVSAGLTACGGEMDEGVAVSFVCADAQGCVTEPWHENATGSARTDIGWNYAMGYHFTPQVDGVLTALGGFFNGTKTVRLFERSTGALLAEASVTAANSWGYTEIAPVNVTAGTAYTVAVYLAGSGGSYRYSTAPFPQLHGDIQIDGTTYVYTGSNPTARPTNILTGTTMYGQADIRFSTEPPATQELNYCAASASYTRYEWIGRVQLGAFDNPSGGGPGYEDFTATPVEVTPGSSLSIELEPGFAGYAYSEHWGVWLDANVDGDFDDPGEELFRTSVKTSAPILTNLTLPQFEGQTRLRVRMWYSSSARGPCGSTSYGQVEDYTLEAPEAPEGPPEIRVTGGTPIITPSSSYDLTVSNFSSDVRLVTQDGLTGILSGTISFTDRFEPHDWFLNPVPTQSTITVEIPPVEYEYVQSLDGWYLVGDEWRHPLTVTQETVTDDQRANTVTVQEMTWDLDLGNMYGKRFHVRRAYEPLRNWAFNYEFTLTVEGM